MKSEKQFRAIVLDGSHLTVESLVRIPRLVGALSEVLLARGTGLSRTVLAERFRHFLGEPPVAYLTRWRLGLAARALTTTSQSVAQIAFDVGYESEAALNRAFTREYSLPPAGPGRRNWPSGPALVRRRPDVEAAVVAEKDVRVPALVSAAGTAIPV